jgi:DNA-directed RNA polymerase II subunit RPB2
MGTRSAITLTTKKQSLRYYIQFDGTLSGVGNDLCNVLYGQKGTMSLDSNTADLPFSETTGISPNIIINPNCMPKRMTIGQLIEDLYEKYCAIKCIFGEATLFVPVNITKINQGLIDAGYAPWGEEIMYNRMTGQKLKVPIFFTPTYYHRLKQIIGDKIHSRRTGAIQMLTQQPPEGSVRDDINEINTNNYTSYIISKVEG